jgi:hypothetical protein
MNNLVEKLKEKLNKDIESMYWDEVENGSYDGRFDNMWDNFKTITSIREEINNSGYDGDMIVLDYIEEIENE